ncbi:carbohydrate ABC transporter permease [Frigoribacterium faeni]|uniref:carbohydrate ABC transporter permease n=1 Tax=Frigoribacterium faeni TaxID=145483 RepID=UPI00141AF31D|nr:sugar ABC transporter permease [Frigoribacterium faeni]NIJ05150.1 N,N'-diacetylchitobiose transport system permease protein [Frigoribacterium faeni]
MKAKEFAAFTAPAVVLMGGLLIVPLVTTVVWSFQNVPVGQPGVFNGLDNYVEIFSDERFGRVAAFTVGYTLVVTAAKLVLGYAIALLLARVRRGRMVILGLLMASYVVPTVIGALNFSWLFNDVFGGVVNQLLAVVGVHVDWLTETGPARTLIGLHALWHETPFVILVLLAGLQTLPEEPLEAAQLDGANWWQRQRYMILPLLAPLISFVTLISIMDSLKVFDSIRIITPAASTVGTESLMAFVYQVALAESYRLGVASAVNVVTIVITLLLLIPFLRQTWKGARAA